MMLCPRVKRSQETDERRQFNSLRLFTVGDGPLFETTLAVLAPDLAIEHSTREEANLVISVANVFSSKDGYCYLRVTENGMEIHCRDNEGARNAAAIFAQLLRREQTGFSLPCGWVEDWPDASYRGFMLESSGRAWLPMERLYQYIREMALARMNVMVFHFMESPGCTIQLDCYPDWHGFGPDNLKYSKQEIRDMVAFAASVGISVCPFVEVISHSTTFNEVAEIACPGDTPEHMFAVCVGQEKTFEAIERVLTEVAELFPYPVLHIGGDEYDMSEVTPLTVHWDECPRCRALSARMGYTTYRELFLYAVRRVNRIVNRLGKVAMLWNADIKPEELPDEMERNMIVHYYRWDNTLGREKHYNLWPDGYADNGLTVVNSLYPQTYLDLSEYVAARKLCGWSYLNDPPVSHRNRARVVGGCCCAWEEFSHFERTIPAAILLFGDRFWNAEQDPVPYDGDYGRAMTHALFEGALPADMNVFDAIGEVLPPLKNNEKIHAQELIAPLSELQRIADALHALADTGHPLARIYADMADEAVTVRKNTSTSKKVLDKRIEFKG